MKIRIPSVLILAAGLVLAFLPACTLPQAEASAAYIGAEVAATSIFQKNAAAVPVAQALVADWTAYQGGKLTSADEAVLLKQVVSATKGSVTPTEAALLDGAVQQILANQNASAPTPLAGAAGAIITTVINGVGRAIVVYQTPPS